MKHKSNRVRRNQAGQWRNTKVKKNPKKDFPPENKNIFEKRTPKKNQIFVLISRSKYINIMKYYINIIHKS